MVRTSRLALASSMFLASMLAAAAASAQPGDPAPPAPPGGALPPGATIRPEIAPWTEVRAGGPTADSVGARAADTSYAAKAAEESVRAAAARVDQAWTNFLPRLTATARYTRLSDFTPPSLFGDGSGSLVGTPAPGGTLNPTPTVAVDLSKSASFPIIVNNYLLQGSVVVPISDYFLRINQGYTAASHAQEAARVDVVTARAKSHAEGRLAFYNWVRARGAVVVALQALADQKVHLQDAQNQFQVGNASKADVLRAETGVAAAELGVERAKSFAELTEKQVRVAMHLEGDGPLVPGESLDGLPAPVQGNLAALEREALSSRPELRSIDASVEALRQQAKISKALYYPQVAGVGNVTYANPNQRRVPQAQEWFPTWDVSAQLTWSPNDALVAGPSAAEPEARVAQAEAQKKALLDGITMEVSQAWQALRESEAALASGKRQVTSAEEAYRVARELFNAGRGTSTLLTDAETELTRSRLELLNANVDARVARVRLDHALGRDARALEQRPRPADPK